MTANKLVLVSMIFLVSACTTALAGSKARTAADKVALRSRPSHLGRAITTLPYNAEVEVLGYSKRKRSWRKVRYGSRSGWVPASSLQKPRSGIDWNRLGGGKKVDTGDEDTLALAGKGFSPGYEKRYKRDKKELDYNAVDRMESFAVSPGELLRFAREGKLNADF